MTVIFLFRAWKRRSQVCGSALLAISAVFCLVLSMVHTGPMHGAVFQPQAVTIADDPGMQGHDLKHAAREAISDHSQNHDPFDHFHEIIGILVHARGDEPGFSSPPFVDRAIAATYALRHGLERPPRLTAGA